MKFIITFIFIMSPAIAFADPDYYALQQQAIIAELQRMQQPVQDQQLERFGAQPMMQPPQQVQINPGMFQTNQPICSAYDVANGRC